MVLWYTPGCENILDDILSHQADYVPDGKTIPILTVDGSA